MNLQRKVALVAVVLTVVAGIFASWLATTASHSTQQRAATGGRFSLVFQTGDTVAGKRIVMGSKTFSDCYITNAPQQGTVEGGVINPYPTELTRLPKCGWGQTVSSGPVLVTTIAVALILLSATRRPRFARP